MLLLACSLTAGTVTAQDREDRPHHRTLRSVVEEVLLWALDGLSLPPG
jgi:hypothetical protein